MRSTISQVIDLSLFQRAFEKGAVLAEKGCALTFLAIGRLLMFSGVIFCATSVAAHIAAAMFGMEMPSLNTTVFAPTIG